MGVFLLLQVAETNAKSMELEIERLQKKLEEKNEQLHASASSAEKVSITFTLLLIYYSFQSLLWIPLDLNVSCVLFAFLAEMVLMIVYICCLIFIFPN